MRGLWRAWVWCALAASLLACAPRRGAALRWVDEGYAEAALHHVRPRHLPEVEDAVLQRAGLTLSLEAQPADVFGVPARGYGTDWWLVAVGLQRRSGMSEAVSVRLEMPGWEVCERCDARWVHERMGAEPPPPTTGGGRFARGVRAVTKLVLGVALLPAAFATDLALTVSTGGGRLTRGAYKPFGVTASVLDALSDGGGGAVGGLALEGPTLHCGLDGACIGLVIFTGEGVPDAVRVDTTVEVGGETIRRRSVLPLSGATFPEALASGVPSAGLALPTPGSERW